jgi:hypothetical protein
MNHQEKLNLIQHIFLPRSLPQEENDLQNEILLDCVSELKFEPQFPYSQFLETVTRLRSLHSPAVDLQEIFLHLNSDPSPLLLFIESQNTGMIISKCEKDEDEFWIETFQVSPTNEDTMGSVSVVRHYPENIFIAQKVLSQSNNNIISVIVLFFF